MSISLQGTTKIDGVITMQSAFVAGVAEPGAQRRDSAMVETLGDALNVDLRGLSANQRIATPLLIHKSLMPNGIVDPVKLLDQPYGTFFGQDVPAEDYEAYAQKCREFEERFEPRVDAVTRQLMQQANNLTTKPEAIKKLHELSSEALVQHAVADTSIQASVFGSKAAPYIEEARLQFSLGNNDAGRAAAKKATQTADLRACPFKSNSKTQQQEGDRDKDNSKNSDDDSCEFVSKECPVCHKKNVKTIITKTHITGACGCSVKK